MNTTAMEGAPYIGENGNWYVKNVDTGVKARGPEGHQGPVGPQGEIGPQGAAGDRGPQGIQGEPGPQGDTGDRGPQGIQGEPGLKGDTGDTGPQGEKGKDADMEMLNQLKADVARLQNSLIEINGKLDTKVGIISGLGSPFEIGYSVNYPQTFYVKNKTTGVLYRSALLVNEG